MPNPNQHRLPLTQAIEQLEKAQKSLQLRIRRALSGIGYTSLAMSFAGIVIMITVLRFYGLPTPIRDYVLKELEARGITASVDRLVLDPTGGIVAERVSVFRSPARNDLWLQVDHVRIGIAWFSWWRGHPFTFIKSASVANATIQYPLTEHSIMEVRQVYARVDFEPGYLQVREARARFLNLQLDLKGRIALNGPSIRTVRTPQENERIDTLWHQVLLNSDDLDTEHPIHIQANFNLETARPKEANIHLLINARMFKWRRALVDELSVQASYEDQIIHLSELQLKLARGELVLTGEANLADKSAQANLNSNLDFTTISSAFGERVEDVLSRLSFTELPLLTGHLKVGWKDPVPSINLQADIDWRRFTYAQSFFDHLTIPIAFDGTRLFIPGAELVAGDGQVRWEVLYDRSIPEVKGRLDSNLDPTVFKGLFGAGGDRFLDSLKFSAAGPTVKLKLEGHSDRPEDWILSGTGSAQNFSYKGVAIDFVSADATFKEKELDVPNLLVKRKEGQLTGGVRENFSQRWVRLTNLQSSVLVQEVDTVLGDKFVTYVKPYVLDHPPSLKVDGLVDLNDQKADLDTDLKVQIAEQGSMTWKGLFGKTVVLHNPQGLISVKNRDLTVHIQDSLLYGEPLGGDIFVKMIGKTPDFSVKLGLKGGDFNQMMTELFNYEKTSGKFDFNTAVAGKIGDLSSFTGNGNLSVADGYLTKIPFMSGLTYIVDNLIPGFGLSKVDRATATFNLANGCVLTKDMTMSSAIFKMVGNGSYNYVKDDLDMDMGVNLSGPLNVLFIGVSKLFEYHGTGPLKEVKWAPKNL